MVSNYRSMLSLSCANYLPFTFMQGNEPIPSVAVNSDRDTGYTREIKPKGEFTQRQDQVSYVTVLSFLL